MTTVTHINKSTDRTVAKIIPPKRRHRSTSSVEVAVITNDCYCKDYNNQDNNTNSIVTTDELITKTMNDKAVNSIEVPHSVWLTDQPNHQSIDERKIYEVNNVCTKSEECDQNDSGVYLPEAMLSEETEKHISLIQTESDFRSSGIQDTINFTSKHLISLDPVMPMLDNSHKVSNECEVTAGLLRNFTSFLSVPNEDPKHLLDEAQTCVLCNAHLTKASTPIVDDSHILVENVEEATNDIINRICKCLNCERSLKNLCTENSRLCMDSNFSICGSDCTGSVFHKREKELCNDDLSENKNAVQFLLPKESPPTDVALVSSIPFSLNQCHFNDLSNATEENTCIRQSGLGLLSSNEEQSVSFIKYDTTDGKASSTDISVVNDLTDVTSRNNYTAIARRIPKKASICDGGCCSYSALENFEAVTLNQDRENQWVVSNSAEVDNKEHTYYKSNNCKTITSKEEVHPNKISKSFHLFLKNMLTDDEEYDLNYQRDNIQSSINFKCALNQTEVTNSTEKTNKGIMCLELSKEEPTGLPGHCKVSPRCIVVESCVVCDSVCNGSGYCNQHVCDSEDCCVMSLVSVDTTVPSSNKSRQSPLHGEHQVSLISDCCSNMKKSKELTNDLSVANKSTEESVNKTSEDIIKTNNKESFITVNKSATLPSSGSTDTINKSYNYSHDQIAGRSNAPAIVKSRDKPLKKNKINDDCLDHLRTEMEKNSEVHECGGENNNNFERTTYVRKEWLIPVKKEDVKNSDHMNSDACEEYHVELEKMWGSLGLKIEECSNFPWIQISDILPGGAAQQNGHIKKGREVYS
ncbi:hypothetical protein B7P43_G02224, partial [Cryptotermes secundus]